MSVDGSVAGSAGEVLAITVGNVFPGFGVSESLGETEIDNVDVVLFFANADKEVVGFNISVQEVPRVYKFNSLELRRI